MEQIFNFEQWLSKYLDPHHLEQMNKIRDSFSKDFWIKYEKRWKDMFKKVEANLSLNPKSKEAKALFDEWMQLVNEIYKDFPELKTKVWDAYKNLTTINLEHLNKKVIDFIEQVSKYYS